MLALGIREMETVEIEIRKLKRFLGIPPSPPP